MANNWSELDKSAVMFPKVRKWSERDIMIKLTNLGKLLGWFTVQTEIEFQKKYTDNACDAMNLAYYSLKNRFCKINRHKFGYVRTPEYEPKKRLVRSIYDYNGYMTDNSYTISYTTSCTTASYWNYNF